MALLYEIDDTATVLNTLISLTQRHDKKSLSCFVFHNILNLRTKNKIDRT